MLLPGQSLELITAWSLSSFLSLTWAVLFGQGHFLLTNLPPLPSQDVFIKTPIRAWSVINHKPLSSPMDAELWEGLGTPQGLVSIKCHIELSQCPPALSPGEIQLGLSTGTTRGGFESSNSSFLGAGR